MLLLLLLLLHAAATAAVQLTLVSCPVAAAPGTRAPGASCASSADLADEAPDGQVVIVHLEIPVVPHRLQAWPHPAPVAVREFDARTERTDIHIFDQWCHVATVHDEADLEDALQSRQRLAFDLDTYRLLVQRLGAPLGRDAAVFLLRAV